MLVTDLVCPFSGRATLLGGHKRLQLFSLGTCCLKDVFSRNVLFLVYDLRRTWRLDKLGQLEDVFHCPSTNMTAHFRPYTAGFHVCVQLQLTVLPAFKRLGDAFLHGTNLRLVSRLVTAYHVVFVESHS